MATRTIVCVRSQYVLEPSPELRPVVSRWTALPAYRASLMIVLALALLFTACRSRAETTAGAGADGGAAAPPQPLRVRLASTALSGAQLPVWTAQETGLFTQHGLDLDLSYIATGQTAMGALLSKEVDALSGGPEASLAVAVEGGDAVVVGASLNKIVQAL